MVRHHTAATKSSITPHSMNIIIKHFFFCERWCLMFTMGLLSAIVCACVMGRLSQFSVLLSLRERIMQGRRYTKAGTTQNHDIFNDISSICYNFYV